MENIGRVLVKSIYHNAWVKIEYRNKDNEITKYMIGINDINPFKKSIQCDCFNIAYSNNTDERSIYFDSILAATICEHTYHKTPEQLFKKMEEDYEEFIFLNPISNKENLLDYYSDCFKLDTTPYISKYGMIPGIDRIV